MERHRFDEMPRCCAAMMSRRQTIKLVVGGMLVGGSLRAQEAVGKGASETVIVPFSSGIKGVTTNRAYAGRVTLTVSGYGTAAGSQHSDAFYIFTDGVGMPVVPWHPTEYFNWSLWINGGPADRYLQTIPAYRSDHVYVFELELRGERITFALGVGDTYTIDNGGAYTITVRQGRHRST